MGFLFKFKSGWFGQQILYVRDKTIGSVPGDWKYFYRKATQDEAVKFQVDIGMAREKIQMYNMVKKN